MFGAAPESLRTQKPAPEIARRDGKRYGSHHKVSLPDHPRELLCNFRSENLQAEGKIEVQFYARLVRGKREKFFNSFWIARTVSSPIPTNSTPIPTPARQYRTSPRVRTSMLEDDKRNRKLTMAPSGKCVEVFTNIPCGLMSGRRIGTSQSEPS